MNEDLFRTLLYQNEGPAIDFKKAQYKFTGATDRDKSKLLKDILAFANSWRLGTAYILIGVKDEPDGTKELTGISPADHIDDATLQQFVSSKTNRPVSFSYEPFNYESKIFGIITIPKQSRPTYTLKDFGLVKKSVTYYRRGSSCAEATPEEIHAMGADDHAPKSTDPQISVQFADLDQHNQLGTTIRLVTTNHEQHDPKNFPNYGCSSGYLGLTDVLNNCEYWRELAHYVFTWRAYTTISLVALNQTGHLAKNVRLEMIFPKEKGFLLLEPDSMPECPDRSRNILAFKPPPLLGFNVTCPAPVIEDRGTSWELSLGFGNIQPKAVVWATDPFYLASSNADILTTVEGTIYADNISKPQRVKLEIDLRTDPQPPLTLTALEDILDSFHDNDPE